MQKKPLNQGLLIALGLGTRASLSIQQKKIFSSIFFGAVNPTKHR